MAHGHSSGPHIAHHIDLLHPGIGQGPGEKSATDDQSEAADHNPPGDMRTGSVEGGVHEGRGRFSKESKGQAAGRGDISTTDVLVLDSTNQTQVLTSK